VEGTEIVSDLVPGRTGARPEEMTIVNETVAYFFTGEDKGIWRTDGTEQGTVRLGRIHIGVYIGSNWRSLFAVGYDTVLRIVRSCPWVRAMESDGTVEGTGLAADIDPGPNDSTPRSLNAFGATLLFAAHDGEHGRELWAYPVTTAA
jgi:ELWxxDGT repeat protein